MIAVIGAGSAGLACAATLQGGGAEVVVLERDAVGAAWATRYDRLHLHTARLLSGLPGYRIPRSYGRWPARDRVGEYLRAYAERHALDVRTGVAVEALERAGDGWTLRTTDGALDAERVVVATGLSRVPFLPDWPGELAGELVHSAAYRNAEPYQGRRMLVVGSGNSGAEIAVDLADGGAAEVLLAVRTPPAIVRRDTLGIPSQLVGIVAPHLPVAVADRVAAAMRRLAFPDLRASGLPAPERPYSQFLARREIPIVDVGIVEAVRRGRVLVVPALERFEDGAAVLADGSRARVDAVIAATGYRSGLGPLVGHLGVLDANEVPLVHGADEHPAAPGLHFVGFRTELGGAFRLAGIQAKQLARL